MKNVLIYYDFPEYHIKGLSERYKGLDFTACKDKEDLPRYLKDAEILVSFQCTREMLDMAPNLKWIQAMPAGVDAMPLDEIKRRGIILTNGRGIHRIHMAEYAIASMVMLSRSFHLMFRNQADSKWDHRIPQGEINGSTAGIVGLGAIGEEIAKRASLFGMKVIGVRSNPRPMEYVDRVYGMEDMGEVFKESDYVINLLPSTPGTEKLINSDYFNLMKESACFINIGRGTTVNEPDLIDALKNKKFRAMVSDVFYEEPLPADSPLWNMENAIITPHICGVSPKYVDRLMEIFEHNLDVYTGKKEHMINLVDPERGY